MGTKTPYALSNFFRNSGFNLTLAKKVKWEKIKKNFMLLEKKGDCYSCLFIFSFLKFEWNDNRLQRIFWKNKLWKTVKVVGKFLPRQKPRFWGVCAHTRSLPISLNLLFDSLQETYEQLYRMKIIKRKTKKSEIGRLRVWHAIPKKVVACPVRGQATGLYIQTLKLCFHLVGVSYNLCKFQRLFFQNRRWNLLSFHSNFIARKNKKSNAAVALFSSDIKPEFGKKLERA